MDLGGGEAEEVRAAKPKKSERRSRRSQSGEAEEVRARRPNYLNVDLGSGGTH
jgi:hypothetical protein